MSAMSPSAAADPRAGLAALSAGVIVLALTPILVRYGDIGGLASGFYRLLFALPALWLWAYGGAGGTGTAASATVGRQSAGRKPVGLLILSSALFATDVALWHSSFLLTSVAHATLIGNLHPVFVTVGAWLLLGQRITPLFVLGMGLALAGLVLLTGVDMDEGRLVGDVMAGVAAVVFAGYLLVLKRLRNSGVATVRILLWNSALGALILAAATAMAGESFLPSAWTGWIALVALALVVHVAGQGLLTFAFAHLSAQFCSVAMLTMPAISAGLAWALFGESLSALQALAAVVILVGVALSQRGGSR